MSPAPSTTHQRISGNLHGHLFFFFKPHPCNLFFAPFDVRLIDKKKSKLDQIYTVVQPDLCIICDDSKIDERGAIGAPDLVIEILSRKFNKEMKYKFDLYEEAGVLEYWIETQPTKRFYLCSKRKSIHRNASIN
jgi:Uma2 family endonuclease